MDAQRRFAEPEEDTIFFAGEAVGTDGHIGTVHGAMASGERAARLILDRMPR
jgi:monoamine oxidase